MPALMRGLIVGALRHALDERRAAHFDDGQPPRRSPRFARRGPPAAWPGAAAFAPPRAPMPAGSPRRRRFLRPARRPRPAAPTAADGGDDLAARRRPGAIARHLYPGRDRETASCWSTSMPRMSAWSMSA